MKRIDINHQAQRFSIRKYAFGAASVLIGCVFFLGAQNVSAQEQGTQLPASENAVVNVAENSVAISQAVADKAAAQTTLTETPQVEEKENKVNAPALNVDDKGAKSKEDMNPTVSKTASEVEASAVTATDTKNSEPQVNVKTDSSEKDENKMVTSAPAKETEAEQNEKAVAAENLIQRQAKAVSIPSQGNYVFQETTPVKNAASMSSPTQFNFDKGDKVFYDKVLEADGHQWISYVSYSGIRRYVVIGKLTTQPSPIETKVSGTIVIQNKTAQQFDVIISNVSSTQGIKEVLVPVWSEQNGQDDIIWYQATKQGEGVYKVTVKVSDHKNNSGNYNIHLYYRLVTGELKVVGGKTTTVEAPNRVNLPAQGTYVFTNKVEVKNEARTSSPTQFTFNKGESIYYDSILNADGHQWISYRSYSGIRRYIIID